MALMNQGYPYPQMGMPYPYQPMQQPQSGVTWVQGIEGAKSYPVNAGQTVLLMDSENNCFYLKSVDNSGMPMPLRVFDYKERTNAPQNTRREPQNAPFDVSAYITREEFEARIAELTAQKKRTVKKESATDAE